jgi:hypothetical protein
MRPRRLVSFVRGQRKTVQQLVWRLEDASVFTAKFAVKAAFKGARPILVCKHFSSMADQEGVLSRQWIACQLVMLSAIVGCSSSAQ